MSAFQLDIKRPEQPTAAQDAKVLAAYRAGEEIDDATLDAIGLRQLKGERDLEKAANEAASRILYGDGEPSVADRETLKMAQAVLPKPEIGGYAIVRTECGYCAGRDIDFSNNDLAGFKDTIAEAQATCERIAVPKHSFEHGDGEIDYGHGPSWSEVKSTIVPVTKALRTNGRFNPEFYDSCTIGGVEVACLPRESGLVVEVAQQAATKINKHAGMKPGGM